MKRRSVVPLVCAAALLQAGCGEGGNEEAIRVPQLRLVGPGDQTLSLAATERIERRNVGVSELGPTSLRREVWVRTSPDDPSACAKLGETSDEPSADGGFALMVEMPQDGSVNPALLRLDQLAPGDPVSLFVLWSVGTDRSSGGAEGPLLLDAARYELSIAEPPLATPAEGDETPNPIYLGSANGAAEDAMIDPVPETADLSTCTALEVRSRDPDGDDVETLDELNAGLPLADVVTGSTPLTIGSEVDVVVLGGRGERVSREPLAPTWRLSGSTAPDGSRGGRLALPSNGNDDPLELRIATATPDGSMLVEAAFPARDDDDAREGTLTMQVTYKLDENDADMPFDCLGGPVSLSPGAEPSAPVSEGVYLDPVEGQENRSRLTVRCDSKGFVPGSGELSLPLVLVSVRRDVPGGGEPEVDEWELQGLNVFVHDVPTASDPARSR